MTKPAKTTMGRPTTGRKVTLQGLFEPDEVRAVKAYAKRTGKTVSVVIRELTIDGMARAKKSA